MVLVAEASPYVVGLRMVEDHRAMTARSEGQVKEVG
jgi:hypothetical protein